MNGEREVQMSSSSTAPAPLLLAPPPPSTPAPPLQSHHQLPSSLSLGLIPLPPPPAAPMSSSILPGNQIDHEPPTPLPAALSPIGRVKLADIAPYEGAPSGAYVRAVESLSGSLRRHNAAVIELGGEDAVVVKCALESARMYFKMKAQCGGGATSGWGKSSRGVYTYRAGRSVEDGDFSPACLNDAFRCMGKAARTALCAIARHLRLRSDVFNHLLDDNPLPAGDVSSSVLIAASSHAALINGKSTIGGGRTSCTEVEKGLLTLIASESPGIQVCDPNGHWYQADGNSGPRDLLLITGRALSHSTAGLRPAASYKAIIEHPSMIASGRSVLLFRLMPQSNGVLDCSPVAAAGHVIPQNYQPISVSQFMDDLSTEEDAIYSYRDNFPESQSNFVKEPSLRSVLSDPLSGAFLEDAVVVSCGHSFGSHMLKKVMDMARCMICNIEIETGTLVPNFALQAAAKAVKMEDERRLFHNAALRKRRKEVGDQMDGLKRLGKDNGEIAVEDDSPRHQKGVQYPFSVNERVLIKGNKRTPDKLVGKEAIITSQCLNGWYLLEIIDSGESVRLQYRSLKKTGKFSS